VLNERRRRSSKRDFKLSVQKRMAETDNIHALATELGLDASCCIAGVMPSRWEAKPNCARNCWPVIVEEAWADRLISFPCD